MKAILFVGIGGLLGSIGRYLISLLSLRIMPDYPMSGTLVVNILGSFLLGFLIHAGGRLDRDYFLLLTTGVCGGFTTFSTFSVENIRLLTDDGHATAFIYMAISLLIGLGAAYGGWIIGKNTFGL